MLNLHWRPGWLITPPRAAKEVQSKKLLHEGGGSEKQGKSHTSSTFVDGRWDFDVTYLLVHNQFFEIEYTRLTNWIVDNGNISPAVCRRVRMLFEHEWSPVL